MGNTGFSWEKLASGPMIGIIRNMTIDKVRMICECFQEAELSTLEITMNTSDVLTIIKTMRLEFPDLTIGAGTVCTPADFENATRAGAQFIVTPITDETIIKKAIELGVPIFPGAMTPTEIFKAWSSGASAVKVFPAGQLGPGYIKDILAPLDKIKLVPTGGVNMNNIRQFFKAGATAVGMGGNLLNKNYIESNDTKGLIAHFTSLKDEIQDYIIN